MRRCSSSDWAGSCPAFRTGTHRSRRFPVDGCLLRLPVRRRHSRHLAGGLRRHLSSRRLEPGLPELDDGIRAEDAGIDTTCPDGLHLDNLTPQEVATAAAPGSTTTPSAGWPRQPVHVPPLLRDYFPKHTDLRGHTSERLAAVAHEINTRPRKTLSWATPVQLFNHHLTMAGSPA